MKKIFLSLILAFISICGFSQRLAGSKLYYDSYNRPYVVSKITNPVYKKIVCIIFTIEYEYPSIWDVNRYKQVTIKTNIPIRTTKSISYYIPENTYKPCRVSISKIIFSNGSYKEY